MKGALKEKNYGGRKSTVRTKHLSTLILTRYVTNSVHDACCHACRNWNFAEDIILRKSFPLMQGRH